MKKKDPDEHPQFIDVEGWSVLSRDAWLLHGHGTIFSVQDGTPGFVSDAYLNSITAETTLSAAELEAAGLWERREGGYCVTDESLVRRVINHQEDSDRREAECRARGAHIPGEIEGGWQLCAHCDLPLRRPDGGPIALPHGGGRDTRSHPGRS